MCADFDFIDLFAGIGGMRRGFEAAGGRCVFTSEIDKFARQTYRANFSDGHEITGDIREVHEDDVPPHDLLLAGFPCQPFSSAGVSKRNSLGVAHGFLCETQGTLFFDIARILERHRPRAVLLENVRNLLGHDKGRTFRVMHGVLSELGYRVSWKVVNASSWVPQNRRRIFIAAAQGGSGGFSMDEFDCPAPARMPRMGDILHPEDGSEPPEPPYTHGEKACVDEKYALSERMWDYLQGYAEKHRRKGNGFGYGLVGPEDVSRTMTARYYKDGSEILVRREGGPPRRLTPRECARLMGFDRPGEGRFIIPVSDGQAYRQFGNAVVASLVDDLAKCMAPWIKIENPPPGMVSFID